MNLDGNFNFREYLSKILSLIKLIVGPLQGFPVVTSSWTDSDRGWGIGKPLVENGPRFTHVST